MASAAPMAAIFGCSGPVLDERERDFFADSRPLGFIIFQRNCESPQQIRRLVAHMRDCAGRDDAPVLIDQEGGRVRRLKPPHWRTAPAAGVFAALYEKDRARAVAAARLNARLIAVELSDLNISVNCAPVLDVARAEADPVIGDRAYGRDPAAVAALGRAVCEGLLAGGVLPVVKHIPGHGRAGVDSHKALPRVDAGPEDLSRTDFAPFRDLRDMPWAMTAHVLYTAFDGDRPATLSADVIAMIRADLGFDGVLLSDDLSMGALSGSLRERAGAALAAGCDVALHCNGDMAEMLDVAEGCAGLNETAAARIEKGEAMRLENNLPLAGGFSGAVLKLDAMMAGEGA